MRFLYLLTLLGGWMISPSQLFATSIIPFAHLGEAAAASESVVLARAIESLETQGNGSSYLNMKFEVLETSKGPLLPGMNFTVQPYSRRQGHFQIEIAGDFKPELGKSYLLFLHQNGDVWQPVMLSYYVFEQFFIGTDQFLRPLDQSGIEAMTRPDGKAVEPLYVYEQAPLLTQLKECGYAPQRIWDGARGRALVNPPELEAQDRVVPTGCDFKLGGPDLSRWQNAAIPVYYDDTNNPSGWGGTFSTILSALNSNYTGIDPSDAGSKSYVPNCADGSAISGNFLDFCDNNLGGPQCALIIFDDPCNEIPDLNNCSGTLAFGGSYSSSDTHQFDGMSWDNALYGFVVINNGVPSCLTSLQYERMLTHELTHVYRMGHLNATNYPNQNMNPVCCNAINTKDQECMNYAYPAPAPVELLSFEVQVQGARNVLLRWSTASEKDNSRFSIDRSANGIQFERIKDIPAAGNATGNQYSWIDTQPLDGTSYYLLSQTDFDGTSTHLGIKALTLDSDSKGLNIQPNPVNSDQLFAAINLSAGFEGILEILNTDGKRVASASLQLEKGFQTISYPLTSLPAGMYILQINDGQMQWVSRFIKQ